MSRGLRADDHLAGKKKNVFSTSGHTIESAGAAGTHIAGASEIYGGLRNSLIFKGKKNGVFPTAGRKMRILAEHSDRGPFARVLAVAKLIPGLLSTEFGEAGMEELLFAVSHFAKGG